MAALHLGGEDSEYVGYGGVGVEIKDVGVCVRLGDEELGTGYSRYLKGGQISYFLDAASGGGQGGMPRRIASWDNEAL